MVERVADAKARRSADAVTSARFFHDRKELPWKHEEAFRDAVNGLRAKLSDRHPSFQTRNSRLGAGQSARSPYGQAEDAHDAAHLRHPQHRRRHAVHPIAGHSQDEIDEILSCYLAHTAEQAAAALNWRIDYEAKEATT